MGIEVAVVSQSPGSWGAVRLGRADMEVGIGICKDMDSLGVRLT